MNYNNAQFEASYAIVDQLPYSQAAEIAFSGKSNVGKSSLLNKVLNRKQLARVSATPGKTVTVNFFKVDKCKFVDLPGYGFAKVSDSERKRWAELMEHYFNSGRNIKLVVQLLDIRHTPSADDYRMLDFLKNSGYKYVLVLTKSDKLNKSEREKRMQELKSELQGHEDIKTIPFSALKGEGVDEIRRYIDMNL